MTMAGVPGMAPAYQPGRAQRKGLFIVLEGISGSGKSTLAVLLAERLAGRHFHTVPAPASDLQPYVNTAAQPLPQLAFYPAGALHASTWAATPSSTATRPPTGTSTP
jgi:dTMP kinase